MNRSLLWPVIMLVLVLFFDMLSFFLQVAPSVMGHDLTKSMHISTLAVAEVSAFYFYSYALMQIPAGLLLDRFGAKLILPISLLICALGSFIFGTAYSINFIGLARFVMGIGAAFAYVGVLFIAVRRFPLRYFPLIAGLTELTGALGAILAETPFLLLVNHFGWREVIIALAVFSAILGLAIWLVIQDGPVQMCINERNKTKYHVFGNLIQILKIPQVKWVAIYSGFIWTPLMVFAAFWGAPYLHTVYGFSKIAATEICLLMWLGLGISSPIIGELSNKLRLRRAFLMISSGLGFFLTVIIVYVHLKSHLMLIIFLILYGVASTGAPLSFSALNDFVPAKFSGTAMGINNMVVVLGGVLGQIIVGWILTRLSHIDGRSLFSASDFHIALLIVPICFLVSFFVSIFFMKETRCQPVYAIN